ncbi:mechanosensitive ion channel family protein [Rhodococcus sp. BP-252]|uniref:mechanosensitive ion channel family protein n=1 Tax=unclassified Rhodococcus (in: high G+C Gram-positive bacteria) TaxID=192944 RepID=UPI0012ED8659|nr:MULTISPECIES: mechanosensitive ion channel family protein [unclassified Rhodococcus (in: high G+C Gram-positive bacteria)]MBY6412113.1 mechanosensitive ion channel family protein [Rhodococcus sp. BP-320]MBY6416693.1 mechanosensitive ion channel family protein [Rhodococcus sp. BP-321]MBY6431716.1 mechanosensitive ion channel family protein [Rhodococcus sp. BP-322]MBY6440667.1 mechanosensitive ion channel family protein [Rhodococcus sp. BP-319]MBY6445815.1 mechanosensitive ion channel family 
MSLDSRAFELTETGRDWLVDRPLQIAGYVALAIVLRLVLHKLIDRFTRRSSSDSSKPPLLLRPLRERAATSLQGTILSERRRQRATTIGSVMKSGVSVVILTWFVLSVLDVVGVNVAPFIASAGIVGVALGFGAQNLVRDFLSGIFMLLEDQYGVGDVVDLGEAIGTVESVGLRVTTVRDVNGTVWYCRNGEVLRVGNMSQGFAVAVLDLPVAHTANVDEACEVAEKAALDVVESNVFEEDLLGAPEMLGVNAVSADTVTIRITVKTRPGRQWAVQRGMHREILQAFENAGVRAPYPEGRAGGFVPDLSK